MTTLIATKTYRPDTASVADFDMHDTVMNRCRWDWSSQLKVEGRSEADQIRNRMILRKGDFIVTAHKRRGYIVLEAHHG